MQEFVACLTKLFPIIREFNLKVNWNVVFKALLPLVLTYAPSLYIKLSNIFDTPSDFFDSIHFSLLIGMFYPWMSVANPIISIVFIARFRQVSMQKVLNDNWEILIEMPSFAWNAFQTDKQFQKCFPAMQSKSSSMHTPKPMGQRTKCTQYCWQIYW